MVDKEPKSCSIIWESIFQVSDFPRREVVTRKVSSLVFTVSASFVIETPEGIKKTGPNQLEQLINR
jgi:hypothetical protein